MELNMGMAGDHAAEPRSNRPPVATIQLYLASVPPSDLALCAILLLSGLAYAAHGSVAAWNSFDGIFDPAGRTIGRDFVNYWAAARALFDGTVLQIFDGARFHAYQEALLGRPFLDHRWSYPPHMLLLIWPFGPLPYLWSLAAWSLIGLAVYLYAAAAGRRHAPVVLAALLLAPATYENLASGQNGFLTAALLIAGLRCLGPRPILAGVLFGLLTVKPQLGILLPFALLAARQWQTIAAAAVTAAAMVGASILCFGWAAWQSYFDLVVPFQALVMSEGRGGFLAMMPSAYIALRILHAAPLVGVGVQILLALLATGGVIWTFARTTDWEQRFAVLAVGTFLATPYSFNYDMTTISLAVLLSAARGLKCGFLAGERAVLALAWLLPTLVTWINLDLPIGPLVLLLYFFCLLASGKARSGHPC